MNFKKVLSIILSVMMVLGSFSFTAVAEEPVVIDVSTLDELQAAFDAGQSVRLIADITYSGVYNHGKTIKVPASRTADSVEVTLDLNGHTLAQTTTASGGLSAAAIAIRPGSTLTVTDTSVEGDGKISACNCAFQNEGTLNLQSGSVVIGESVSNADTSADQGFAYGVWVYMVSEDAELPTFNMTGGSISIEDNGYVSSYASAVAVNDGVDGIADYYQDVVINITGGSIEGNVVVHSNATNVTVPDGTDLVYYGAAARIGTTNYESLEEAIAEAQDGDTVELLADAVISSRIEITKSLIIDGNEFGVTVDGDSRVFDITKDANGADVTIRNITIGEEASNGLFERGINYNTTGKLTLENVTVSGPTYAVNFPGKAAGAVAEISNSSLSGNIALNIWGSDMFISVVDTDLYSVDNNKKENYAAVVINDDGTTSAKGTVVEITGGSIVALNEDNNPSNAVLYGTTDCTVDISDTTDITGTIDSTVAYIIYGNAHYAFDTLQGAFDYAKNGETVTLVGDVVLDDTAAVPADGNLVLDLNGYTISQTKEQTGGYQMILNDGNLTIKDSVGTGKISYTDSGNGGEYISDTIYNRGTLVINGGTIENLSSETVATNGYPHAVDSYTGIRDTYVTINDGTIYCASYSAIRMFCVSATNDADLVINGGTIKGAVDMQNGTLVAANGSLTIAGGTFEKTASRGNVRFANWNPGATEFGISAPIEDGTFDSGINTTYVPATANWDSKIVSGGSFGSDISDYVADGYEIADNGNGSFGVVKDNGEDDGEDEGDTPSTDTVVVKSLAEYLIDYVPVKVYPGNITLYRLGIYAAADSADYDSYGFEITVDGENPVCIEANAYGSALNIVVGGQTKELTAEGLNYDGSENVCIFGQIIAFPSDCDGANRIKFRPYVVDNGETKWGYTFTLPDLYTK